MGSQHDGRATPPGDGLRPDELDGEGGDALPDRQAMSTMKGGGISSLFDNFAMPINEAIAVNNESTASFAIADADQIVIINQTDVDEEGS